MEARYRGQSFEIPVAVDKPDSMDAATLASAFHLAHEQVYGYGIPDREVTAVNCRVRVEARVPKAPLEPSATRPTETTARPSIPQPIRTRQVSMDRGGRIARTSAPVYRRADLTPGATITGPAIIEEMSSTTWLGEGDRLGLDAFGNLVIDVAPVTGA